MSKQLGANISFLAIIKIVNYALPLVVLPHLTYHLGAELFGVIAVALAIQQIVWSVCDYGFNLLAPKLLMDHKGDKAYTGRIFVGISLIKCGIFAITASVVAVIMFTFVDSELKRSIWLMALWPALAQSLIPIWLFLSHERMSNITLVTITERVIYTIAIFVFIGEASDVSLIPMISGATMSIALVIALCLAARISTCFSFPSLVQMRSLLSQGWGYFYSRITMMVFSKFNVLIVNVLLGESAAGVFSIAERIYNAVRSMVSPVTDALYPYMIRTKNWPLMFKIIKAAIGLCLVGLLVSLTTSEYLFTWMFGVEFIESAVLFQILSVAIVVSIISMLIGYPVLGVLGKQVTVNRSVLVGALVHFVVMLGCYLTIDINIYLLAVSLVVTELVILSIRSRALYINRHQCAEPAFKGASRG